MTGGPGFHRCHAGSENIQIPATVEIALFGTTAAFAIEARGVRLAVLINACPICLEPLTPVGRKLDRMKRVEGLK